MAPPAVRDVAQPIGVIYFMVLRYLPVTTWGAAGRHVQIADPLATFRSADRQCTDRRSAFD